MASNYNEHMDTFEYENKNKKKPLLSEPADGYNKKTHVQVRILNNELLPFDFKSARFEREVY